MATSTQNGVIFAEYKGKRYILAGDRHSVYNGYPIRLARLRFNLNSTDGFEVNYNNIRVIHEEELATAGAVTPTNNVQIVNCEVSWSNNFVSVKGTKNTLSIESNWDLFYGAENELLDKLMAGEEGTRMMPLTVAEMKLFAGMVSKVEQAETAPIPEVVAPVEEVVAPAVIEEKPITPPVPFKDAVQTHLESTAHKGYVMLVYDIPSPPEGVEPIVNNPSTRLWRHGFRVNLSCWCIPEAQLASQSVKDLLAMWDHTVGLTYPNGTSARVKYRMVKYAESELSVIKEMALEAIDEETRRIHTSLIQTIDSANTQWQTASQEADLTSRAREKKADYREYRIRAALKTAAESLNRSVETAIIFDSTEDTKHLFQALREAIAARELAFQVEYSARRGK